MFDFVYTIWSILGRVIICALISLFAQGCIPCGGGADAGEGSEDGQAMAGSSCGGNQFDRGDDYVGYGLDIDASARESDAGTCDEITAPCGCWGAQASGTEGDNDACDSGVEVVSYCYDGLGAAIWCADGHQAWALRCTCS